MTGYGLAAAEILRLRERKIKVTASVDQVAASGGYMMACVADRIVAAPFAIVGSIGVVAPVPNVHRLLKKNEIDFEEMTAGEFKRTVSVFGEITPAGREHFRGKLDATHAAFKAHVARCRPNVDIDRSPTATLARARGARPRPRRRDHDRRRLPLPRARERAALRGLDRSAQDSDAAALGGFGLAAQGCGFCRGARAEAGVAELHAQLVSRVDSMRGRAALRRHVEENARHLERQRSRSRPSKARLTRSRHRMSEVRLS